MKLFNQTTNQEMTKKKKNQRPEVKGTLVAGNHEFPAIKFPTVNFEASEALVMT